MHGPIALHTTTAAPAVLAAASSGGTDWTRIIGTIAAVISALAVVVGALYWVFTRRTRAERAARERQVSGDVAEMGDRIEHLQRVVDALAEEQRGRRPQPRVAFYLPPDGPVPDIAILKVSLPPVDIEAIVRSERDAAFATLLPIEAPAHIDLDGLTAAGAADSSPRNLLGAMARAGQLLGVSMRDPLPVTEEDHTRFEERVETYEENLRDFIADWIEFFEKRRLVVVLTARIDNDGGVPAEDARVRLHFPDPCVRAEFPAEPERPRRPKFAPRRNARFGGGMRVPASLLAPQPRLQPPRPNLTGPFYEDGSLVVRFDYSAIPHHDPFQTDTFVVGVPEPGIYDVAWSIGAKNLALPEKGTLRLAVRHEDPPAGTINTLDSLLDIGRPTD
jgi:hypothetical protein